MIAIMVDMEILLWISLLTFITWVFFFRKNNCKGCQKRDLIIKDLNAVNANYHKYLRDPSMPFAREFLQINAVKEFEASCREWNSL